MEAYPQSIIEFREWFPTAHACRDYIAKLRWPDGFVCPRCQTNKTWTMRRGKSWCVQCGYQVSATAGTLFHDTHKQLRLWFEAMWYVTSQKYEVWCKRVGSPTSFGVGQLAFLDRIIGASTDFRGRDPTYCLSESSVGDDLWQPLAFVGETATPNNRSTSALQSR